MSSDGKFLSWHLKLQNVWEVFKRLKRVPSLWDEKFEKTFPHSINTHITMYLCNYFHSNYFPPYINKSLSAPEVCISQVGWDAQGKKSRLRPRVSQSWFNEDQVVRFSRWRRTWRMNSGGQSAARKTRKLSALAALSSPYRGKGGGWWGGNRSMAEKPFQTMTGSQESINNYSILYLL